MFVWTFSKKNMKRVGALAVCLGCLAGTVAGVNYVANQSVSAAASAEVSIGGTQDIGAFFSEKGIELDLATAAVDSVKIPKRWDDSFLAFNTVVAQSGLALDGYKGKTVEKWTALCPGRSGGEEKTYGVMLVYKGKAIGAYLLGQPSGEVTGLAQASMAQSEAEAAAPFGEEAQAVSGAEWTEEETEASVIIGADAGDWPVE